MSIHRDGSVLLAQCDTCGVIEEVKDDRGRLPPAWATGQLWIDLSMSEQRQIPLCFCPACAPSVTSPDFDPGIVMQGSKV